MKIKCVLKSDMMLLETIQERSISRLQAVIIFIHENDTMEIVMHEALRVKLSAQSYSAVSLFSIDRKVLVKQIIQTAVDVLHSVEDH